MRAKLKPKRIADDVIEVTVDTSARAQVLAESLRAEDFAEDVVAGLASVSLRCDPVNVQAVIARLSDMEPMAAEHNPVGEIIEIAIRYGGEDGPDFDMVCGHAGLSSSELIALHTEHIHTVEMIGFTPGFSYISGLPEGFTVPRLSHPRSRVPGGAIGISAAFTGIYALPGPGGWPLIGRTSETLFDAEASEPFLLKPRQRVRFRAA